MTAWEEYERRALLHSQAAALLRADAEKHLLNGRRLRKVAKSLKAEATMKKVWTTIEQTFLSIWLWLLERNMFRYFDRDLSRRIDAVRYLLEG
jgi:hypothetical protein